MRKPKIRIYDSKKRDTESEAFKEVLRLQILIHNLSDQGYDIEMYNRVSQTEDFEADPDIKALYASSGDDAFPCMKVDDDILVRGEYPKNEQIMCFMGPGLDLYGQPYREDPCANCQKCGGHC